MLVGTGRFEEGLNEIRRAEELDPLSLREMTITAWSLYQVRRFEESIGKAQQIINLDRNNFQGHMQMGNALLEIGEAEKGLAALRESLKLMPGATLAMCILCFGLVAAGRRDEAEAVRDELLNLAATTYVKEYFLAMAHLALGDHEQAFVFLDKASEERDPWLVWFGTEPKLDPLRTDARFAKIFRATNNPLAFR